MKSRIGRILSCASVAAMLVVAAIGSTPQAANAQEAIKIGVLLPFTGPWAKNGNEAFVAMEIARTMINERGGINGRMIEFVRGDAVNASAGKTEAERVISRHGVKNPEANRWKSARSS